MKERKKKKETSRFSTCASLSPIFSSHPDWRTTTPTTKLPTTPLSFVHGALHLPLEPVHNARLVELAEAVEAGKGLAHLILLHANRAFGHAAIFSEAVLLSRRE